MKIRLGCELGYTVAMETTFVFSFEVSRIDAHEGLVEKLAVSPPAECEAFTEPHSGNRYVRVVLPAGSHTVTYSAELDLKVFRADPEGIEAVPVRDLPLAVLPHLLPSRYVPSDRLTAFALREFGDVPRSHAGVTEICNWIHDNLDYRRGSSTAETIASEILLQRAGVCRDFAHLGIAFCRALGIPARFVSCYAVGLDPPDFHAVFEAYLGDRWWLFDPTRQAALDGLVRIGIGRDAAEVAFSTPFGDFEPGPVDVWIEAEGGDAGPRTVDAISVD